jgi:hypothetical protein
MVDFLTNRNTQQQDSPSRSETPRKPANETTSHEDFQQSYNYNSVEQKSSHHKLEKCGLPSTNIPSYKGNDILGSGYSNDMECERNQKYFPEECFIFNERSRGLGGDEKQVNPFSVSENSHSRNLQAQGLRYSNTKKVIFGLLKIIAGVN